MKKFLTLLLVCAFVISVTAQDRVLTDRGVAVKYEQIGPGQVSPYAGHSLVGQKSYSEVVIGDTWYDIQTLNWGCVMPRIYAYPDGTVGATWQGAGENLDPERGTGYNYYNGTEWGEPDPHVGNPDRTGTPSYAPWGPNGEIFCHYWHTGAGDEPIRFYKRATKGEGEWVETILNGPEGLSLVWHTMTTSGENHEYIHLLAYTYDAEYMGQTHALLYYRSSDGAETWDIDGEIIDGLGEDFFPSINSLSYTWANPVGSTIAFTYGFDQYGGLVFKSTDNGDNWEKIIAFRSEWDPLNPPGATDVFPSGVGSSAIALDSQGKAHVVFTRMNSYWNDAGDWYIYPMTDGLIYWNEDMPRLDTTTISTYTLEYLEEGGNLVGTIISSGPYTVSENQPGMATGACGFPNISITDDDKIFVAWSGVSPDYTTGGADPLFYRHIVMNASFDGGNWWNGQIDINTSVQWILSECVFPEMAPVVDDIVHVVFQEDNTPGTFDWPAEQTERTENRIYHMSFPISFFVGVEELPETPSLNVSQIHPNPAHGSARFIITLEVNADLSVTMINMVGQSVKMMDLGSLAPGKHPVELNLSDLKAGVYYLSVIGDGQQQTRKLVVR
jgi:hypothetical protein